MNKRLMKRHKRQVARAKEHVKLSEPDVRTPEEVAAAREASRNVASRREKPRAAFSATPGRIQSGTAPAATPAVDGA